MISTARVEVGQLWTNQMMAEETGGDPARIHEADRDTHRHTETERQTYTTISSVVDQSNLLNIQDNKSHLEAP